MMKKVFGLILMMSFLLAGVASAQISPNTTSTLGNKGNHSGIIKKAKGVKNGGLANAGKKHKERKIHKVRKARKTKNKKVNPNE